MSNQEIVAYLSELTKPLLSKRSRPGRYEGWSNVNRKTIISGTKPHIYLTCKKGIEVRVY